MRTLVLSVTLVLAAVTLSGSAESQEPGQVAQEFRRAIDALKGHTWESKVVFTVDGAVRSTELYRVTFKPDGTVDRELLESEGRRTKQ